LHLGLQVGHLECLFNVGSLAVKRAGFTATWGAPELRPRDAQAAASPGRRFRGRRDAYPVPTAEHRTGECPLDAD